MLSRGWVRGLAPGARRVLVFGDSEAARGIAHGSAGAGCRVTRHDIGLLRTGLDTAAGGLVLDAGSDDATLAEARRAAAQFRSGTIGVVVESWPGFIAALALDAALGTDGARLRPLCAAERGVRAVLAQHPWWRRRQPGKAVTAVIAGTGTLAEHLVIALFRAMHLGQRPQVVMAGAGAPDRVAALHQTLPQLKDIGELTGARSVPHLENACVYVTRNDADLAGLPPATPLVWLAGGEAPARARAAAPPDWSAIGRTLFDDPQDGRARAIHDFYFEAALREGNRPGSRPSMLPWRDLPERFRQASRYQADHVADKLAMIGARAGTAAADWRFRFTAGELDMLARAEHERWSAVQRLDGWRYGPARDDAARLTPFLAPYDSLPPEIQDRDRMSVRQIPAQLARIGQVAKRDLVVTLTAEAGREAGFALAFRLRGLLADIAAHYPDRRPVLATALATNLERRVAAIALDRKLAPLCVLLPPGREPPPETQALLARAERLLVTDAAPDGLHLHIGENPPPAPRLVTLTPDGRVRTAPWL